MLRQMVHVDGQRYRIARAIDWIKQNFTKPLRIDDLAEQVQMSAPSFHNHFRRLTSMSPLQYQKSLRLHEAKRLMTNQHYSASSAAFEVGYESPSQFNREYSRMFGNPPKRHIQKGHHSEVSCTRQPDPYICQIGTIIRSHRLSPFWSDTPSVASAIKFSLRSRYVTSSMPDPV